MNRTMPAHILIVDDEAAMRSNLREVLQSEGYRVSEAAGGREALDGLEEAAPDLVMLDLRMPDLDGMEVLSTLNEQHPDLPVIMLTAHGTSEASIRAMKLGAYDYVEKPFELEELLIITQRALDYSRMLHQNRDLRSRMNQEEELSEELVGGSSRMRDIFKMVGKVADTDTSVLLEGESGTGKEMIADALQSHSRRVDKPYIKVNCGALPESLLESELFGHEAGSFTGAGGQRKGRFELADTGTLFLDEIDAMTPALQVKLLRVLQKQQFERIGGEKTLDVDVRIIAASNRHLETEVREGRFRQDLYYRLNVIYLHIPPLRDHPEDIPDLAAHFLKKFHPGKNAMISGRAMQRLMEYHWPGNIRELENVIQRGLVLSYSEVITVDHLPSYLQPLEDEEAQADIAAPDGEGIPLKKLLADYEKKLIRRALDETEWNRTRTARLLGINRRQLFSKMKRYGLDRGRS